MEAQKESGNEELSDFSLQYQKYREGGHSMQIQTQLQLNKNYATESEVGSGWVEIENTIKFPIRIRKYIDKTDGKEKLFVSYPQRKQGNGYENIVHPENSGIDAEIQEEILRQFQNHITKGLDVSEVSDVRVSLLEKEQNVGSMKLKAIASVKICGCWINRIMVKESQKGIFVQMPQYQTKDGQYKDIVYGTSSIAQLKIKGEVEYAYEKELEKLEKAKEKIIVKKEPPLTEKIAKESQKNVQDISPKAPKL